MFLDFYRTKAEAGDIIKICGCCLFNLLLITVTFWTTLENSEIIPWIDLRQSNKQSSAGPVYIRFCSPIPGLHGKVELSWSEHRCISKWGGMRRDPPTSKTKARGTCHSRSWWIAAALALQIDWEYSEQLAERKQEGDWGNHQVAPVNYDTVHLVLSIFRAGRIKVISWCAVCFWYDTWFPCMVTSNCGAHRMVRNSSCCCGLIWTIWITFFFHKWPEDNTANYSFLNVELIMNIDKALISY